MGNWTAEKIINVVIEEINPYENNPRVHSDFQIEKLKEAINEFGFTQPILLDEDKNIIAGHGRHQAAKELGMPKIPAIILSHLSERQKKALIISDNKLSELSKWDFDKLSEEVSRIAEMDFDLDKLAFNEQELDSLLMDDPDILPDEAPKTIQVNSYERTESGDKEESEKVYQLVVACDNEEDQKKLSRKLKKEGYTVKKLVG